MKLSKIITGCMHWGSWGAALDTKALVQNISNCFDMGITSFDHADIYGHYSTESDFGEALKYLNIRKNIQLITKCGIKLISPNRPDHTIKSYDASAAHIINSAERSLLNLKTDYIDVLLIHRPDILLHPQEVAEAFYQLKKEGKVLNFGVSNFTVSQMQLIQNHFPIQYNQLEISPLMLDPFTNGQLDYCINNSITPMAWSPMKGGAIYKNETLKATIDDLAIKYNCTADSIVYAWLLQHPSDIHIVAGSSKMERLKHATNALTLQLTREDWYVLYTAALGTDVA